MHLFLLLGQIIVIIILLLALCLMFFWMWTALRAKVPFISVPTVILGDIAHALAIDDMSVVYDLGCGDARVLSYLAKQNRKATYIGIENGGFPALLARVITGWNKKRGQGTVQILQKDFFTEDLSRATHIFLYLYPNVMDDLLPKFDKELKKGTRVVSATFTFTQKQPIAEIDLQRSKYKLARKLYVYEF